MRVAYFTNQYPAPSHTFIRREIVALEARGHTVARYAIRAFNGTLKDGDDLREATQTGVLVKTRPVSALCSIAKTAIRHPGASLKAIRSAFRFGKAANGRYLLHLAYLAEAMMLADWCHRDVVEHLHVHFGTNSATVAALAHDITGIPFSFTVHGPEEFDRPEFLALGEKIRRSRFVAGVSSYGRSQLMRWADVADWAKIKVVHCGIDEAYTATPPEGTFSDPRFVCIARMSEQKGHHLLLKAAAQLKDAGTAFQLSLVGDGPLRADLEAETRRLGLEGSVIFTGTLSQEAVRAEILAARAMVLPSFAEGLPMVLMESLALRRPVISTFIAGIPELVRPDCGWLVPAGDVDALCDAMRQALSASEPELAAMGETGRSRALERHDINRSAALIERLIQS